MTAGALASRTIVVTRPAHQAATLAAMIEAAGGRALLFPVIAIADIDDRHPLDALIDRLDEFRWAIFVSPNAVHKALTAITARRALPPGLQFAAVGGGTVNELAKFGVSGVTAPDRFDSEALLGLPPLQDVAGQRIVIFRGVGGREILAAALTGRGAKVEYAECYRRVVPAGGAAPLITAWNEGRLDAITVTSSEGVRNLAALVGERGRDRLAQTPVFAPHPRIARTARELGVATVVETAQGDDGLFAGLHSWFASRA